MRRAPSDADAPRVGEDDGHFYVNAPAPKPKGEMSLQLKPMQKQQLYGSSFAAAYVSSQTAYSAVRETGVTEPCALDNHLSQKMHVKPHLCRNPLQNMPGF
jgi:hypothetical protein